MVALLKKIPWFDLTSVFPTPPINIGIDESCFALDPIDFIAAYLDTISQQPVS